jgi:peptidoglycan/LPS O-acetylase OafA/YrhL
MSPTARSLSHAEYLARGYVPELDGLRALSVLLVVTVHLYDADRLWRWLDGGKGVTIFFLLSGYLITTLALREEGRRGAVSLAAFYVRRGLRIFPLYYFTLGLYCLLILGLGASPHLRPALEDALPWYLLYFQEVPFFGRMIAAGQDLPFFQSWSLGIEEKFYLLWPLLAFVLWRGRAARRRGATALLAAAFLLGPAALAGADPSLRLVARSLTSYAPILAGCLVAFLLDDGRCYGRLRVLGRGPALAAAAGLLLAVHFARPWLPECPVPFGGDALYVLAASAFLAAVLVGEGPVQRLLRAGPLVFVGRLSYGIYLVHVLAIALVCKITPAAAGPAASVLTFALAAALSTAAAWLLAVVLERPCIELGRRWSRRLADGPGAGNGTRVARIQDRRVAIRVPQT